MKIRKMLILFVIVCTMILGACSNTSDEQTTMSKKFSDTESVQLKLDCNDITVEVGEEFVVSATCVGDVVIHAADVKWQMEFGIIDYKNIDWTKWNPNKAIVWKELVKDINPFEGTEFIAGKPGITELFIVDSDSDIISDICKVTVVEKKSVDDDEKAGEVIEENKSDKSVLYSKNGTTILLKNNLPTTVSYAIGGKIDSSCDVLNVSVGKESYMGIGIDIECEKTYEKEIGTHSAFCWKLYDSTNMIVEDGHIANYNVSVGERFKETFTIYEELSSEMYTLVFTDFN